MRLALIADIHGNLAALDAVLRTLDQEGVDRMVCLGDVAEFGPQPREVLARLRERAIPVIMGNTDERIVHPQPFTPPNENVARAAQIERWIVDQLLPEDRAFMGAFHATLTVELGPDTSLLCFHGSPLANTDVIVALTPEDVLDRLLGTVSAAIFAGGHTHSQLLRRYRQSIILNPGSVGMPFEITGVTGDSRRPPWAEYAVLNYQHGALSIDLRRAPVDMAALADAAHSSDMPNIDWWLKQWGIG